MALTDEMNGTGMVMPVSPMYGGSGMGNGFGDGSGWWIILLFILLFGAGGWGNNYGNGSGFGGLYPWMNQADTVNAGFQNAALSGQLNGIQTGVNGISTQLCNGFAGVNAGIANGFAQAEIAANSRQMASMNQAFGLQTAMAQGFNQLGTQFADCCCENRLANCQTQNIIQNEGNATRFADANNTRDLLTAMNAGIQSIKDQLCDDKIEQKNDLIAQLRSELMYARGQASQDVQTAAIQAGQRTLANEIEQYVLPTPRPAYVVANPNCCTQNACGCGSF